MADKKPYYITTAIAYTSGKPHIGNTYEIILADAIARYKRSQGYDVFFQTGTDEHGQKIELKAEEAGVTPKEFVDNVSGEIKKIWDLMDTSYDKFIRTTDEDHEKQVQKIFKKLYDQGDIYKGHYEGMYCTPCESFFTESQLVDGKCPDCGRPVQPAKEEAYFFNMKKYADKLQEQLTSGEDYIKNVSMLDRQIRSIKHDMNNQLQVLSGLINNGQFNEASDFLKQYGIGLEKTIDYINTNNPVINTLINSKIAYAKSENIITAIDITKDIKPMTGNDLCSIIGNVIDNAIEAELHEEESLRQLHIQAYWDDEEMVFHVSNYINKTVLDRNSGLATTKEDKNSHGLGTNIVKSLAKRNYGTCDYYETENEFHCEIRW